MKRNKYHEVPEGTQAIRKLAKLAALTTALIVSILSGYLLLPEKNGDAVAPTTDSIPDTSNSVSTAVADTINASYWEECVPLDE